MLLTAISAGKNAGSPLGEIPVIVRVNILHTFVNEI